MPQVVTLTNEQLKQGAAALEKLVPVLQQMDRIDLVADVRAVIEWVRRHVG